MGDSEEIELDGLSSLEYLFLGLDSVKRFSVRNFPSLKHLVLYTKQLNKSLSTQIFGNLTNIKELEVKGVFSDINLDYLVNLEKLAISGKIVYDLNFDLLKNLCKHLTELSINITNFDDQISSKLFQFHYFPNLVKLCLIGCKIKKLEKKLFDRFPMLQSLSITFNKELLQISNDAFSNLTNLIHLDLSWNIIESINQIQLSGLIKLETLLLSNSRIESIEENSFSSLKSLNELVLRVNNLSI